MRQTFFKYPFTCMRGSGGGVFPPPLAGKLKLLKLSKIGLGLPLDNKIIPQTPVEKFFESAQDLY